jgi:hypothetical protein
MSSSCGIIEGEKDESATSLRDRLLAKKNHLEQQLKEVLEELEALDNDDKMVGESVAEDLSKLSVEDLKSNIIRITRRLDYADPEANKKEKKNSSLLLVDDISLLENAVENLSKYDEIAFDCEGVDLSRNGALTLACFCGCGGVEEEEETVVYMIDVLKIGQAKIFPQTSTGINLKTILESHSHLKIMFDSRSDSDALYHQFGVRLANVLDLQVFDQGCRIARGESPPARSGSWVPYVKGMKAILKNYLSYEIQRELDLGGDAPHSADQNVWGKRPLNEISLKYASDDVLIIKHMLKIMKDRQIPDDLMHAVVFHSNKRVGEFRESPRVIVWDGSKAMKTFILEEHPIVPQTYRVPSRVEPKTSLSQVVKPATLVSDRKTYNDDDYYRDDDDDDDNYDYYTNERTGFREAKDYTACDSECGYCGKCDY